MAQLSSNWKKLQAKLNTESSLSSKSSVKRKADDHTERHPKRKKTLTPGSATSTKVIQATGDQKLSNGMGGVHSTKVDAEPISSQLPSLSLWAANNDVSAEALAEAYDLGTKDCAAFLASQKDRVNSGLMQGANIGKYVAMDCEMVGVGPGGHESVLARVSIVDFHGNQVYDSFVKPKEPVTDYRTKYSGITRKEMRFARQFEEVQREVHGILKSRILIGHDVKHDLDALKLSHLPKDIRDTSKHMPFKKHGHGRKPALRVLARQLLGLEIQTGVHSSLEDARATLLLFRRHKSAFDVDHANRYSTKTSTSSGAKGSKPKKKRR